MGLSLMFENNHRYNFLNVFDSNLFQYMFLFLIMIISE